jgi:hypothetical protein
MTSPESGSRASKLGRQLRWALVAIAIVFLAVVSGRGGAQPDLTDDPNDIDPVDRCTVTVTADVLNVRAGPGTEHPTVDRLSRNAQVDATAETSNGFRKLADNRWVSAEHTDPSPGCN